MYYLIFYFGCLNFIKRHGHSEMKYYFLFSWTMSLNLNSLTLLNTLKIISENALNKSQQSSKNVRFESGGTACLIIYVYSFY